MPIKSRTITIGALCSLVVLAIIGIYLTGQPNATGVKFRSGTQASTSATTVDESPLLDARNLRRLATTQEEDQLSVEAIHQADHEVDLAYTMALRRAHLQPPLQTPETKAINEQIHSLETQLKSDDAEIERVKKLLVKPGTKDADTLQDQLELVQAQRGLHDEELDDAHQDLIAAGGDNESAIQKKFKEHEILQHMTVTAGTESRVAAFEPPSNLASQGKLWYELFTNRKQIVLAQQNADKMGSELANRSQTLSQRLRGERQNIVPGATEPNASSNQRAAALAAVRTHVDWRRVLADYSKRISDEQQLSKLYSSWAAIKSRQVSATVHVLIRSLLWVFLILLAVIVAELILERYLKRLGFDRRRLATMRMIFRLSLRTLGVLGVLIVLFGPPTQLSTIVAFAGAGLTVALKDFIVAFFGWFVLMGKNGVHVGDWVEIDGIGGEVVEIGLLRTVLMETGNWNDSGHPTGRKVAFVNSFAMEKHFFNFTTKGQWLWDELSVLAPPNRDPNTLVTQIQELIAAETNSSIALAEQEWQRATHSYGVQSFSAAPAINTRPTAQGIVIVARYITQANERYGVRTRLYKEIVDLMRKQDTVSAAAEQ